MFSAQSYDPAFQTAFNGPLSDEIKARLNAVRRAGGLTITEVAVRLGLAGSFLGNLLRGYVYNGKITAIRTKHGAGLMAKLELLEENCGLRANKGPSKSFSGSVEARTSSDDALATHIHALNGCGFAVTLTPLEGLRR